MGNYQKKGFLTEDFRLFHLISREGTRPEFHYHEFYKVLLLVSGSGSYMVDGSRYAVAQKVVSTGDDYTEALVESGTIDGVDAVSGATYLYEQFVEATNAALKEASK